MILKRNKLFIVSALTLLMIVPFVAFAGLPDAPDGKNLDIETLLNDILKVVWPVAVTVIIIFFILAGFKFMTAQGNPEEIKTARRFVIWAIAGIIVVILSFSIVQSIKSTFFPNP